jgi:hypothetical protein
VKQQREEFSIVTLHRIQDDEGCLESFIFSAECTFHVRGGKVNFHSCRVRGCDRRHEYVGQPKIECLASGT